MTPQFSSQSQEMNNAPVEGQGENQSLVPSTRA